jgi:two-component system cell cycle response regulator
VSTSSTVLTGIRGASGAERGARKVLAAEDNPVIQSMLRSMLTRWGYEVSIARNGIEAWEILQSPGAPRLAILDWMMPVMDGLEVCRRIRASDCEPYVYVLLLTARTESADLVVGMDAGADDYITKPFNAHELRVRLRAASRILDLQEELLVTREALREQATHDSLTGVWNRGSILDAAQNEMARAERESHPLAVLMVDLDRFKQINDTHGHLAGDAVLREAAHRMKGVLRCYDAVGRYGGEEFVAIIPASDGPAAFAQAERIRESVGSAPVNIGTGCVQVTCSIGVAWSEHPSASDTDQMLRDADLALYRAKAGGRNRVEFTKGGADAKAVCGLPSLAAAIAMPT